VRLCWRSAVGFVFPVGGGFFATTRRPTQGNFLATPTKVASYEFKCEIILQFDQALAHRLETVARRTNEDIRTYVGSEDAPLQAGSAVDASTAENKSIKSILAIICARRPLRHRPAAIIFVAATISPVDNQEHNRPPLFSSMNPGRY
jgi:hypothetical protein